MCYFSPKAVWPVIAASDVLGSWQPNICHDPGPGLAMLELLALAILELLAVAILKLLAVAMLELLPGIGACCAWSTVPCMLLPSHHQGHIHPQPGLQQQPWN
jgi:hypothetical protein